MSVALGRITFKPMFVLPLKVCVCVKAPQYVFKFLLQVPTPMPLTSRMSLTVAPALGDSTARLTV